jgi:hypothetical protein
MLKPLLNRNSFGGLGIRERKFMALGSADETGNGGMGWNIK